MIATTQIHTYDDTAKIAHDDASLADASNEGRVLALAARLRTDGAIPIPGKGLIECYISAFLEARDLDMRSTWTERPAEYLSITTPDGRSWIRRYASDAGDDVWQAMHRNEDVSAWSVLVHRPEAA